jgi:hypothetical protein
MLIICIKELDLIKKGCEMSVYLIPLELHDFDIILCMDWLTRYKA